MDQEELGFEQDEATLGHARFVALIMLIMAAIGLYLGSLFLPALR